MRKNFGTTGLQLVFSANHGKPEESEQLRKSDVTAASESTAARTNTRKQINQKERNCKYHQK